MLNVKPNELFYIKGKLGYNLKFYIDFDLNIKSFNESEFFNSTYLSNLSIKDFLTGKYEIIKITLYTQKEQTAINYLKTCGYKWLAKYSNGDIVAFDEKPIKTERTWLKDNEQTRTLIVEVPMHFLSWKDDTPYYIGDEENE
jgi:hypothetical protein